jgi:tetratricopeptide (TPR) repeat protein
MRTGLFFMIAGLFIARLFCPAYANAQEFRARRIADRIFVLENVEGGEDQAVIASDSGLVILNSFWSEITAQKYKNGIMNAFERDDFIYLINMVDRLDMFGGNAAYKGIPIIGHKAFWDRYRGKEEEVSAEIEDLIEMWRWKEKVARERLPEHEPGSERALGEQRWINTCKQRADELEQGFSLVLPTEIYEDRKTLDLGDITLNLIWFGKSGCEGMTVIEIPEEKVAIIPGFIMHSHHLAPYPQAEFKRLDIPRWIQVLEEILEGDNAVDNVLCDINQLWSRERALTHLNYIRKLWNSVSKAEAEGRDLAEIQQQLSLDNDFAFVREMQEYKDGGDDRIRPQHQTHVRLFFLQNKNLASELMKRLGIDSLSIALRQIRKIRSEGGDIYIDEVSINAIGYYLLNMEKYPEAIEVLKLNVEIFPQSFNVYDSYAEALMKSGDIENAILNYEKSLALNPDNNNAREILNSLEKR